MYVYIQISLIYGIDYQKVPNWNKCFAVCVTLFTLKEMVRFNNHTSTLLLTSDHFKLSLFNICRV